MMIEANVGDTVHCQTIRDSSQHCGNLNSNDASCPLLLCRYKPFIIAEVGRQGEEEADEQALQAYLAGHNDRAEFMELTTPLFRDSSGNLFHQVPGYQVRSLSQASAALQQQCSTLSWQGVALLLCCWENRLPLLKA